MIAVTSIQIEWETRPAVSLIVHRSRPLNADEIRLLADVVEVIESFRELVGENEVVTLP